MHVTVVGAGVFGAWTALWLRRRGASVTLVDRYGAGNSLASSGGESRATRSAHGPDRFYPGWQRRSLTQWIELDPHLFVETGVLWLARRDDGFEAASADSLDALGIPAERLSVADLGERWPQLRTDGLAFGLHEPEAGVLLARRAVAAVAAAVAAEGGETVIGIAGVDAERATLDGRPIDSDAVVFAAGPWLPMLLGPIPDMEIGVPRQEIVFFATPPGDSRFDAGSLPTWVDYDAGFYGMPSIEGRGFKVAPDWPGPQVDPDRQDRRISDERVDASRAYLRERFPALETSAGERGPRLPVRGHRRHPLHHRSPSLHAERVDRWWWIGPWLQARAGGRGVCLRPRPGYRSRRPRAARRSVRASTAVGRGRHADRRGPSQPLTLISSTRPPSATPASRARSCGSRPAARRAARRRCRCATRARSHPPRRRGAAPGPAGSPRCRPRSGASVRA